MGNTQSKQHENRLSRPLSEAALASSASLVAAEAVGAPESPGKLSQHVSNKSHQEGQPAPQPQPCQCQWCIDYAVPDPYQTPSTPLEEFFEFRRQFLSRMGAKNSASPASPGASPAVEDDSRSPVSAKMGGFKRRFSRSKTNFQRRMSLTSNGDNAVPAAVSPLQAPDPVSPALVGLGLVSGGGGGGGYHGDIDGPLSSPQNPPSGQPRLISARRRSFNIPTRFPLFSKSRQHVSHQSDSIFHYKSNTEPLRRSWSDIGAATETTPATSSAYPRPRSASPARAISPSEQGYTHLGTFKFGSLHVVNGCASPAPSSKRQRSYPDLRSIDQSDFKPESETEQEQEQDLEPPPEKDTVTVRGEEPAIMSAVATPPPIPKRSSSRLNGHRSEDTVEGKHQLQPTAQSPSPGSRPKLAPLVTSRRPSVSWFDDCPTSPPGFGSPDSVHLRPLTPPPVQPTPALVTTTKQTEHDDNLFEDEGMEIPVFWDDTVQSHESFHDPHFHSSLSKERQDAKKLESSKRSGALNKTDSGYSSASGKSAARHRYASSRGRNSRDRNCRLFDADSNQALIHCDGSINDPVEGTISITSHGDREIINAVFPWPPAHLRYPVEAYTSQAIRPKQQPQEAYELQADSMSEYNLDPTYPVRAKYEPSRPPPIPPRFREPKQVSRPRPADSQHTQCKIPSPVGLAIDISPKCISPREPSHKDRAHRSSTTQRSSRNPAKGHAKGHSYKSQSVKEHTTKTHASASNVTKSNAPKSNATKRHDRRYRDSTPARMTGEKPPTASHAHARSASDATSSRPQNSINMDKPLPALPSPSDIRFPTAQMLTPPLSRSTSTGDLKLLTNTSPEDLMNYIDHHTPVEIDNNLWGSLSADPEIDLELVPLNLDLNKSALHDYQPRKSLQESINQTTTRQPSKLHRSASHFSFSSSINQKPSGRFSTFPPSPVRDVFSDRKSRKAKYQSTPPTSYRFSQLKSTMTEGRSSRLPRASSSSCAVQMALTHQKPGALNHIESYL